MFFVLSKILSFFILPWVWIFFLLIWALLAKRRWIRVSLRVTLGFMLFIFTNPFIANKVMLNWEKPAIPFNAIPKDLTKAVVLSGVTNNKRSLNDRVYLNKGADRILHALQLVKIGQVDTVYITGGGKYLSGFEANESTQMKSVFNLIGVSDSTLVIETSSNNTYENAVEMAKIWNNKNEEKKCILITSAFHMRRAQACFQKQGFSCLPFSTDFYSTDKETEFTDYFYPSTNAMLLWEIVIREYIGLQVYRILNYC